MSKLQAANEKRWQREDDARTLARAQEIKSDKKRLFSAKKEAVKMLAEKNRETEALKKVAK